MPKPQPPKTEVVSILIEDLVPLDKNPRRGHVESVIQSLQEFGQHRLAVVQRSTNMVLVGNHMLKAAQALNWTHLDCMLVDDDDEKAIRRALADNRTGDLAEWEELELAALLREIQEPIPGFDAGYLDMLEANLEKSLQSLPEAEKPTYEIVPRFDERYDSVTIFAENEIDWTFLQTALCLKHKISYKNQNVGVCRVMTVKDFAELWRDRPASKLTEKDMETSGNE